MSKIPNKRSQGLSLRMAQALCSSHRSSPGNAIQWKDRRTLGALRSRGLIKNQPLVRVELSGVYIATLTSQGRSLATLIYPLLNRKVADKLFK